MERTATKDRLCFAMAHMNRTSVVRMVLVTSTPQPLYNTIVGVQDNFHVSYPIRVITRVKYIDI